MQPLHHGDIVDIIAPASRCSRQELQNGLRALRQLGLRPRVPKDLFARQSKLFSHDDEVRLKHLRRALYATDSKMIWCVRGGYGSLRLIPEMLKWKKPRHRKIVLGYSDITTLHAFLNQNWQWPTLHGPLLDRFGRGVMPAQESRELLGLLYGRLPQVQFQLKPLNKAARQMRAVRGQVVGGNMAVLQSSLGTAMTLKNHGRFVFFEDTGERPHRVDRMLVQMTQAQFFKGAKAVLLGHFLLHDKKDQRDLWSDVFARFAREMKIPVLAGLPVGHDPKLQMTLPLGTSARLQLGVKPVLQVDSGIID